MTEFFPRPPLAFIAWGALGARLEPICWPQAFVSVHNRDTFAGRLRCWAAGARGGPRRQQAARAAAAGSAYASPMGPPREGRAVRLHAQPAGLLD